MSEPARATYLHRSSTVECILGTAGAAARGGEWRQLGEQAGLGVETIPGGRRLWLEPRSLRAAAELIRLESECCGFLDFDLVCEGGRLRLDVTSPVPGAGPVIAALVVAPDDDARTAGFPTSGRAGQQEPPGCC